MNFALPPEVITAAGDELARARSAMSLEAANREVDLLLKEVVGDIGKLLGDSITGVDMPAKPAPVMDLSKIDFEALRSRFKEPPYMNTDLEVLKAAIRAQLESLIRLNQTRADFAGTFKELIESDNNGSRNIVDVAGRIA